MVIEDLYRHQVTFRDENSIKASLLINPRHEIFHGHFPEFALTPGVCQLLMIREILEDVLKTSLMLRKARQIKFTAIHEPGNESEIKASISFTRKDDILDVSAQLVGKEKVYLKFRGEFKEQR